MSLLNTDVKRELDHLAAFFKMAVAYADKIGFKGQFLIEPKPKEPSGHQYDYDAQTVIGFLKTYGLDKQFKLNIEPNHGQLAGHRFVHDVHMAAKLGFLGSIDANTGSEDLGWDTDQFPMDLNNNTQMMLAVLQQKSGGIAPGGFNFDCKVRRESSELEDLFWGHVGAMDALALALRRAAAIIQDGVQAKWIAERYSTYDSGLGAKIEAGKATLEECEEFVHKHGVNPSKRSGKQEKYEVLFNRSMNATAHMHAAASSSSSSSSSASASLAPVPSPSSSTISDAAKGTKRKNGE
jgi:xylose isomerase